MLIVIPPPGLDFSPLTAQIVNQFAFQHSSRNRPFQLSKEASCLGQFAEHHHLTSGKRGLPFLRL